MRVAIPICIVYHFNQQRTTCPNWTTNKKHGETFGEVPILPVSLSVYG
ncbi:hypothetical protein MC7420_3976 [Coleofasciculus chthonoplastes PCC 7420]|uniref:Uncharacterized protein n=1 Tax=Coleofasciculus chthonoplastes PCC 7420 TaxID=118168 RepID=B4VUU1_9CYAN|nr:hypothetical protein MC7420_3976 [Coleofasciculus chthonoplastes PCC 7420]